MFWKYTECIKTYGNKYHHTNIEKYKQSNHMGNWQFGRSSKWCHMITCQGANSVSERDRGARSVEGYCFQLVRFGLHVHRTTQVHSNQCSMDHPNLSEAETEKQLKSKKLLRKILIVILCPSRLFNMQFQKLLCSSHLDVRHSYLQFKTVQKTLFFTSDFTIS